MELHLDRRLANRRVFPAINVSLSGTRQEELLFKDKTKKIAIMRRMLELLSEDERSETFLEKLRKTKSNEDFLKELGKD